MLSIRSNHQLHSFFFLNLIGSIHENTLKVYRAGIFLFRSSNSALGAQRDLLLSIARRSANEIVSVSAKSNKHGTNVTKSIASAI